MKIIFFNPYADVDVKGASRRIEFLTGLLSPIDVSVVVISSMEYANLNKPFFQKMILTLGFKRLAYFLFACDLTCDRSNLLISEVIFTPTWRPNFILTVHDLKVFNEDATRGGGLRKLSYWLFIKLASRIIVVSNYTRNDVIVHCKVSPEKISVVPNGISDARLTITKNFQNNNKAYDFVYVSSFAKHKRHSLLINSLPSGSSLALIGRDLGSLDGVKDEIARRGSEVNVDVYCNVDTDEQLFGLISSAHCGVFPSVFEGFGIPLLEYAACGLFVVATDIPPFRELEDYVDIFVKPDNKDDLQQALKVALHKSLLRNQLRVDAVCNGMHSEEMIKKSLYLALGIDVVNKVDCKPMDFG